MKTNTVKHMIKDPNGKRLSRVFVSGKGWFNWNTAFHVYNNASNYEQMKTGDVPNVDFSKSGNQSGAFSTPSNSRPDLMTVKHGRKGQATEYVEYSLHNKPFRWFAQKSGEWFIVGRYEVNSRGRATHFQNYGSAHTADAAASQAHDAAINDAERS